MNKDYFLKLAHYNQWANAKICKVITDISEEGYKRDMGVFFSSIHGTLNHILVGDTLWLSRLQGRPRTDLSLDSILCEDVTTYQQARQDKDKEIIHFLKAIDNADLQEDLHYHATNGTAYCVNKTLVLAHIFNHQTHHRGQVHDCLTQQGHQAPALDLIYFALED